jgi:hypothetical protein
MRRRLATLAAVSMFALALSAGPVLADSHGDGHADRWVVLLHQTTDLTGSGMTVACGRNTYAVTSGSVDQLWLQQGAMDDKGFAIGPGRAIETWTLDDVRVQNLDTHRTYRAVGSQQLKATWLDGADIMGDNGGPFTGFSDIVDIRIRGTRDGHSLVIRQVHDQMRVLEDSGTCADLQLMQ